MSDCKFHFIYVLDIKLNIMPRAEMTYKKQSEVELCVIVKDLIV